MKRKWKWPLMWRKNHEKALNDCNRQRVEQIDRLNSQAEKERGPLRDLIERMKLLRVTRPETGQDDCYQFTVRLHRGLVEGLFIHGNSDMEIEWVAREIGHNAARCLRGMNFYRPPQTAMDFTRIRP